MTTLSPVEQIALAKYKPKKGARAEVQPGDYSGNLSLDFDYDIRVGENYEQAIVGKVPWMAMVGVLLSKVNGATLQSVITEAESYPEALQKNIKASAEAAMSKLADGTMTDCNGKVTGSIVVTGIREKGGLND